MFTIAIVEISGYLARTGGNAVPRRLAMPTMEQSDNCLQPISRYCGHNLIGDDGELVLRGRAGMGAAKVKIKKKGEIDGISKTKNYLQIFV